MFGKLFIQQLNKHTWHIHDIKSGNNRVNEKTNNETKRAEQQKQI